MNAELFPPESVAMESPRLRWLRENSVRYSERRGCFTVWTTTEPMRPITDADLDRALELLAARNGWATWNQ